MPHKQGEAGQDDVMWEDTLVIVPGYFTAKAGVAPQLTDSEQVIVDFAEGLQQ